MPGQRDRHSGCVAAHMVENDLFDFMLLSLPDNDTHSHRYGPYAQASSIVEADRAIERMMHAGGGIDAFLEDHAVIVLSDHSQTPIEQRVNLAAELDHRDVLMPDGQPEDAEIAVSPAARSAMVYVLDPDDREAVVPVLARELCGIEGVDLVAHMAGDEAIVRSARGAELRFQAGGDLVDLRGGHWSVEGDLETLGLAVSDGRAWSRTYPDALSRLWSALHCPRAGDVLVSASPGLRVRGLGRRRPRRRRQPRRPPPRRLARRPDHVRDRSRVGVRARPVDDPRRRARDRRPLRHPTSLLAACRILRLRRGSVPTRAFGTACGTRTTGTSW